MPANKSPVFTETPDVTTDAATGVHNGISAAAADYTGAGANNQLIHTAAVNGSFVRKIRCKALGTNVAAVLRVYINNGSTNATATNNVLFAEIALPATTASTTAPTPDVDYIMDLPLPGGFKLYCGLGAAVAAGWDITVMAGKY